MSEQDAPAPEEDQPVTEVAPAPEGEGTSAQVESFTDIDPSEPPPADASPEWLQERHKQMHADYTRKTQELAEQRKANEGDHAFMEAMRSGDPEAFKLLAEAYDADPDKVLEQFGLTQQEVDEAEEIVNEVRDPRVDQILADKDREQQELIAREMGDHITKLAKEKGVELTPRQHRVIFQDAAEAGAVPDATIKAFEAWFTEDYEALSQQAIKGYRESKKATSPPVKGGSPGVPAKGPLNERDRLAYANEVAQRAIDSAGG